MKKVIISLIFITMLCNITCKKSTDPVSVPCSSFTNITETDATGSIYGNTDTDDWQPSGILTAYPAYPNHFTNMINIHFDLAENATLKITVNNSPNRSVRNLIHENLPTGHHTILWDGKNDSGEEVPDCIYRVYLSATKDGAVYETYGDVKLATFQPH
jgi:hypothetical protein